MQLAWNMLEVAKLIFSRDRDANALDLAGVPHEDIFACSPSVPSSHVQPSQTMERPAQPSIHDVLCTLAIVQVSPSTTIHVGHYCCADVHMLLGDLSAENDAFEDALEEYRTALQLLNNHLPKVRCLSL